MCKKTPLYDTHIRLGGKMVPFAGYELPVQYETGIIAEHLAVRNACGVFDVSHMGEVTLSGGGAEKFLQKLLTNDMSGMAVGRCRYSPMCNERGGVVDDLLVYKTGDTDYLLIVNAANKEKDVCHIARHLPVHVKMEDISDRVAQLALQGPRARDVLRELMNENDIPVKNYTFLNHVKVGDAECLVSRTGYTGENGYEIYLKPEDAPRVMDMLLEKGKAFGLIPCGLGARDTLRLEASMPLYGHEMDEVISPLEAGLNFFVKMDKADFIGKEALQKRGTPQKIRVGLQVNGRGVLRELAPLYSGGEKVGETTSGTMCPYLQKAVAMALVDVRYAEIGTALEAEVRGRRLPVTVVELPFYKAEKK